MREPAPTIFPIFRSRLTSAVLTRLYVGGGEHSIADLAGFARTDTGSMTREIRRLEQAGVVRSHSVGRTKLVSANQDAPFYPALLELVTIVLGPAEVIGQELSGIDSILSAAIFGSWAARAHGQAGASPDDIDLLVIGHPDRDDLHDALTRARIRLGRDINPVIVSQDRWATSTDPFLVGLRNRPLAAISGIPVHSIQEPTR